MADPKDILLLIDGTLQGPENSLTKPTNVERLACFLNAEPLRNRIKRRPLPGKNDDPQADAPGTVVGYLSGVGADTPRALSGLSAGAGLLTASTIRRAYKFLIRHYQPNDRIFLFGFSRGAFAVRSLAGFVDCVGVGLRAVPPAKRDLAIEEAYYAYEHLQGDTKMLRENIREYVYEYLAGSTHNPTPELTFDSLPIYFIGIWDAVGALGLPSGLAFATNGFNSYHQTHLPPNVSHAFHALSLHELRSDFAPHIWTNKRDGQELEQRWFAGDHSDVGGGHDDRKLSDLSLVWMLRKAESVGLDAIIPLRKAITRQPIGSGINQIWHKRPFYLLSPAVREILKTYSDPNGPAVLGSSFDDTVLDRLAGGDIDYSSYRIGFGKTFLIRSPQIQADALKEVDQHTIRGILRESGDFKKLTEQRQNELLASLTAANWRDAQAALVKQHGEQNSHEARHGIPHATSTLPTIQLKTTPKPPAP